MSNINKQLKEVCGKESEMDKKDYITALENIWRDFSQNRKPTVAKLNQFMHEINLVSSFFKVWNITS